MASAPFARLESKSTAAVFAHLSNAQAEAITQYATVINIPVIFDAGYIGAMGDRLESAQPQCLARSTDVADLAHGCTITIGAGSYVVAGLQPDGTGITTVILERSA